MSFELRLPWCSLIVDGKLAWKANCKQLCCTTVYLNMLV